MLARCQAAPEPAVGAVPHVGRVATGRPGPERQLTFAPAFAPHMRISVIGLGKLGCPLAVVLATKDHVVVGVDLDESTVASVAAGIAPVEEPRLQELLTAAHKADRISATSDVSEAVRRTAVTFVVVPTPTDDSGGFSLDAVLTAMEEIGHVLRERDDFHLVVLTSTVLPDSMRARVLPTLEHASGKTCGADFGLCYNPEFIALGSVVADLLNPDFILIGESDERSGDLLASIYDGVCENEPAMARMGFANAEVTKLAVNTFVTTKISYANMLAELCERIPGGDVDTVTRAIGLDSRIGGKYLRGATAYGGPCFPRDNVALAALLEASASTRHLRWPTACGKSQTGSAIGRGCASVRLRLSPSLGSSGSRTSRTPPSPTNPSVSGSPTNWRRVAPTFRPRPTCT